MKWLLLREADASMVPPEGYGSLERRRQMEPPATFTALAFGWEALQKTDTS